MLIAELIEADCARTGGDFRQKAVCLSIETAGRVDLYEVSAAKAELSPGFPETCEIIIEKIALRPFFDTADGDDCDAHLAGRRSGVAVRAAVRPDLLEIVEAAHFRAEEVDNDVANIEQHPVSIRHALNLYRAADRILHGLREVVCDGSNVTGRATRRDNHHVGEGRFSLKINRDDVFGLIVFETIDNRVREGSNVIDIGFGGL